MAQFKVKFFGSKERKEQIKQVKIIIEAERAGDIEDILRGRRYGYKVVNGLKINKIKS